MGRIFEGIALISWTADLVNKMQRDRESCAEITRRANISNDNVVPMSRWELTMQHSSVCQTRRSCGTALQWLSGQGCVIVSTNSVWWLWQYVERHYTASKLGRNLAVEFKTGWLWDNALPLKFLTLHQKFGCHPVKREENISTHVWF